MQESGEMYLETILILGKRKNVVRSIDIAEEMGYSKASVSRAVSKLKHEGYIIVDTDGHIALTEKGYQLAQDQVRTDNCVITSRSESDVQEEIITNCTVIKSINATC